MGPEVVSAKVLSLSLLDLYLALRFKLVSRAGGEPQGQWNN